jgi:hypothetical protein
MGHRLVGEIITGGAQAPVTITKSARASALFKAAPISAAVSPTVAMAIISWPAVNSRPAARLAGIENPAGGQLVANGDDLPFMAQSPLHSEPGSEPGVPEAAAPCRRAGGRPALKPDLHNLVGWRILRLEKHRYVIIRKALAHLTRPRLVSVSTGRTLPSWLV